MARSLTQDTVQGPPQVPPEDGWGDGGSGGGGGDAEERGSTRRRLIAGLVVLLVSTTILFGAFTTALVMRRSVGTDWLPVPKPRILLANTVVLLLSSAALHGARRALHAHARTAFNFWWTGGTLLGMLFLAGQCAAWKQLQAAGVYMGKNPSNAFFYTMTVAHALHLCGGLTALLYVEIHALRLRLGPVKRTAVDLSAILWHFLDATWLYLMLVFYVWA